MKKNKLKFDKKTISKLSKAEKSTIEGGAAIITSCTPVNDCCGDNDGGGKFTVFKVPGL